MSGPVHVFPIGDLVEHADTDCICGPTLDAVFRDDGSNGWLYTHHSLDGREHHEHNHDRAACALCSGWPA